VIGNTCFVLQFAIRSDPLGVSMLLKRRALPIRHDIRKKGENAKVADESEFLHRVKQASAPETEVIKLNESPLSERLELNNEP
jgi:hypothetical protein